MYGVIASRGNVESTDQTVRYFASLAGYDGEPRDNFRYDADPADGTLVQVRSWYAKGRPPVSLASVIGGGHTVPHPKNRLPRILGRTSHDVDSSELIWVFFTAAAKAKRNAAP
jgi:polyhydroxybutyrate depolymerase